MVPVSILFSSEGNGDAERVSDLPRFINVESRCPGSNSSLYDSNVLALNQDSVHFK